MKERLNITVDKEIKTEAAAILESMGLDFSGAMNLMLYQIVRQKALPFRISDCRSVDDGDRVVVMGEDISDWVYHYSVVKLAHLLGHEHGISVRELCKAAENVISILTHYRSNLALDLTGVNPEFKCIKPDGRVYTVLGHETSGRLNELLSVCNQIDSSVDNFQLVLRIFAILEEVAQELTFGGAVYKEDVIDMFLNNVADYVTRVAR